MSARRQARARAEVALLESGGVPACLAIGRCLEIWGGGMDVQPTAIVALHDVRFRFRVARSWWISSRGISEKEGWSVVPAAAMWSAEFMMQTGRKQEAVRRLAEVGCVLDDLPKLALDADELFEQAATVADRARLHGQKAAR